MNTHAVNFNITEHFKYTEMACPCCGELLLITELFEGVDSIEEMRQDLGFPMVTNSGHRCKSRNKEVAGEEKSMHLLFAWDGKPEHIPGEPDAIWEAKLLSMWHWFEKRFPDSAGIGIYNSWVHFDPRRQKARWDYRKTSTTIT